MIPSFVMPQVLTRSERNQFNKKYIEVLCLLYAAPILINPPKILILFWALHIYVFCGEPSKNVLTWNFFRRYYREKQFHQYGLLQRDLLYHDPCPPFHTLCNDRTYGFGFAHLFSLFSIIDFTISSSSAKSLDWLVATVTFAFCPAWTILLLNVWQNFSSCQGS